MLLILRTPQYSTTKGSRTSDLNGHTSEPHSRTAALQIEPVIDNRISSQHHRCLNLVNTDRSSSIRKNDISSNIQPSDEIQLTQWVNISASTNSFPGRVRFSFESIPFCNTILHFEGVKRTTCIHYCSYELLGSSHRSTTHLHILRWAKISA